MDERQKSILNAAWTMFARYGFSKTTISDIANEAGVARQTVYNVFPGKEEILQAVVRIASEESLSAVEDAWGAAGSLEEKLAAFHTLGPISWFEAMRAAPDWAELMDGVDKAAKHEIAVMEKKWIASIQRFLVNDELLPSNECSSSIEIAEFIYSTSKNAKYGAEDIEHLKRRLATIRLAILQLLEGLKKQGH